jgi:hypothetical protein
VFQFWGGSNKQSGRPGSRADDHQARS